MSIVQCVISGGQTGADLAGLRAAEKCAIATDGFMPKGFQTELGSEYGKELAVRFGLKECSGTYSDRDMLNVDMADGLIAFLMDKPMTGRGTTKTLRYAESGKYEENYLVKPSALRMIINGTKPVMVIWITPQEELMKVTCLEEHVPYIRDFLRQTGVKRLMVSGPCESTQKGVQDAIQHVLEQSLCE